MVFLSPGAAHLCFSAKKSVFQFSNWVLTIQFPINSKFILNVLLRIVSPLSVADSVGSSQVLGRVLVTANNDRLDC